MTDLENHMVLPVADDDLEEVGFCRLHRIEWSGRCPRCQEDHETYMEALRREQERL